MRSRFLLIVLAITMSFSNSLAKSVGAQVAEAVLFLPGLLLEEYLASLFDEDGAVQATSNYIFLPYIKLQGVHSDYERYIIQTFAQYVKDIGRYKLKSADKDNLYSRAASVEITNTIAQKRGCPYALYISVDKKSYGTVFKFVMKDTKSNEIVWHDEYTALIPEDIPPILFRVANTMGTGKIGSNPKSFYDSETTIYVNKDNLQEMQEIQKVEEEPQATNETLTRKKLIHYGFEFYGSLPFGNTNAMLGLGINGWLDLDRILLELDVETHKEIPKKKSLTYVGLNLWIPISHDKSSTPYVGGGAGFSTTSKEDEFTNGCTAIFEAGYLFGRFKSVNFKIGARYFRNFYLHEGHHLQGLGLGMSVGI